MQNVLAKHEMFEEIYGGETSKQGQEVESVSCQANNVGQFRQALIVCFSKLCYQMFDLFFIFSALFLRTESWGVRYFTELLSECRRW